MRDPPDFRPSRLLGRQDHEIHDEIRFYLEERARELEEAGLAPEEARREALKAFGDPEAIARRVRREGRRGNGGGGMTGGTGQDLRYALRTLAREPLFTLAATLTLALAIGANAAIFGVADAVLLTRPPVADPERLVSVYTTCRAGDPRCSSSYPDYLDYREARSLEDLAGYSWLPVSVAGADEPPRLLTAMTVTGNYFELLGVAPALGRPLQPSDDRPGDPAPVAVLAHDTWRSAFGADPTVVGRTLRLNEVPFRVVGVAPHGFRGTALGGDPDLFLPITAGSLLGVGAVAAEGIWDDRGSRWIDALVGRLAPGATLSGLRQETQAMAARLNQAYPDERGDRRITVDPATRYALPQFGREDLTRLVAVLSGVVVLTLLLASANVANLLLARGSARRREMAVRAALGSGTGRLLRQRLVESAVLAAAGGALGLAVARILLRRLTSYELPGGVPLALLDVGVDGRVLAFSAGVSLTALALFGLAPALRAARVDPAPDLRAAAGASPGGTDRLRRTLVAVQVGLCLVLLAGSALFLRGLRSGLTYELGVRPEGLALARFDFTVLRYEAEEALARVEAILEGVERLPGVTSASVSTTVPLQVGGSMGFFVTVDGYEPRPGEEMRVEMAVATPRLARTLGIPLVDGAYPDRVAELGDEPGVLVNRRMAEAYWNAGRAVGGTVRLGGQALRVRGVTEDAAWRSVPQPPLNLVTVPLGRFPDFATRMPLTLAVRTTSDPEALLGPLREAVLAVDENLTFHFVRTMDDLLRATLAPQRMGSLLLTAFGALATVLASVGIGGVVAYVVGRRRREIGIRIALGATRGQVQRGALREVSGAVVTGLGAGLLGALLLGRALEGLLIDASVRDPWPYALAAALLALVALGAAWVPARRAARMDPLQVLQAE